MWLSNCKTGVLWLLVAGGVLPSLHVAAIAPRDPSNGLLPRAPEPPGSPDNPQLREETVRNSAFKGLKRRDLASDQARLLELEARKRDLDRQIEFVGQARINLSAATASLLGGILGSSPISPALAAKISQIQELDKLLEREIKRLDVQRITVRTEIEAVQKIIQKSIEGAFGRA